MRTLTILSRIKDVLVIVLLLWLTTWMYDAASNRRYLQRVYVDIKDHYDIVAFGDSLIEGLGATQTNGFIGILSDRLGVDILNQGIRRNKTFDLVARVSDDVLAYHPRLVIMTGGGNDLLRGMTWSETKDNLRQLFSVFQAQGVHVLYLGVPTGKFSDPHEAELTALTAGFDNVTYVPDIMRGVLFRPGLMFDLVHPDDEGHKMIADRIEPILRKLLDELAIPYEHQSIPVAPSTR